MDWKKVIPFNNRTISRMLSISMGTFVAFDLLYNQALLMEGFPIKDPVAFSNKMCELMVKACKYTV